MIVSTGELEGRQDCTTPVTASIAIVSTGELEGRQDRLGVHGHVVEIVSTGELEGRQDEDAEVASRVIIVSTGELEGRQDLHDTQADVMTELYQLGSWKAAKGKVLGAVLYAPTFHIPRRSPLLAAKYRANGLRASHEMLGHSKDTIAIMLGASLVLNCKRAEIV